LLQREIEEFGRVLLEGEALEEGALEGEALAAEAVAMTEKITARVGLVVLSTMRKEPHQAGV
jgi:hypothetical protein